jgi:serine/threonine-protein kinase RsbW
VRFSSFQRRRQQQQLQRENIKRLARKADAHLCSIGVFDSFEQRSRRPVGWQRALVMARTPSRNSRLVLRLAFEGIQENCSFLEINAWMPSEVRAISPLVDWLMRQIEGSRCVAGCQPALELALQEALSNAVIHGNRMDADKLAQIQCQCEAGTGATLVVTDHGQGFDPSAVPQPLAIESLKAEHGLGIHLMKLAMDEVSFERGGTAVRMWKKPRQ